MEAIVIRNNLFWVNQIKANFLHGINFFARCMEEKIIPAFDSIDKEADEVEKEAFENPSGYIDPEYYDPSDAAENAFEKGLEYYEWMTDMLQGAINLFVVGLYHIFEQQLLFFHRKELLGQNEKDDHKLFEIKEVDKRLRNHDIKIKEFDSWSKVDELRLVANTVKHADGISATLLKDKRPDLFSRPSNPLLIKFETPPGPVYTPLMGDNIYITKVEFTNYVHVVKEFWNEMRIALENQ